MDNKNDEYIRLFQEYDDPKYWEYPPDFDYAGAINRFRTFVTDLEKLMGVSLKVETESHIQDASFHSQVFVADTVLRFSNFGNMVSFDDESDIEPGILNSVKALLNSQGYSYIPSSALYQDYTGRNRGVTGIRHWWIRYFDWV